MLIHKAEATELIAWYHKVLVRIMQLRKDVAEASEFRYKASGPRSF